jgi:hypothetical protein
MATGRRLLGGYARFGFVFVVALAVAYLGFLRPVQMRWGATDLEVARPMPGDTLTRDATFVATRAVTIDATPEQIWPWIAQMGAGRAGFYGYDWIDNRGAASADRILPQFQSLHAGDTVPRSGDARGGYLLKGFSVDRYLLWQGRAPRLTWCWSLYPVGASQTRLVTRVRFRHPWTSLAIFGTLARDLSDAFLVSKSMDGIKARAEAASSRSRGTS